MLCSFLLYSEVEFPVLYSRFSLWSAVIIIYLFIYLFLAALGLHYCAQAFSCGEQGLLLVVVHGLLIVVASLVVAHGLSCSEACGIFPHQSSNPCPCIGRQILFLKIFIYFIFGCAGSSLLSTSFSLVAASRGHSSLWCAGFPLRWLLLLWSTASRHTVFYSVGTQAQ